MFNYSLQLAHSANKNTVLPIGRWLEKSFKLVRHDNSLRIEASFYYFAAWFDAGEMLPLAIDFAIIRNGREPFYKDFVNFDGAFRDETGRFSTDISDLLPFDDFNYLEISIASEDFSPFAFDLGIDESVGA